MTTPVKSAMFQHSPRIIPRSSGSGGLLLLLMLVLFPTAGSCDDWPQWLGPNRDSVWRETGLVETISEEGLPILWRTPIEGGYAGPSVADGRVYVMDYIREGAGAANDPNARSVVNGKERILCLSASSGEILWSHEYDRPYEISYASGPRCTPTVDDGRVYAMGAEGDLTCLDARTGEVLWAHHFKPEYGAETPLWGYSSHPLIWDDLLIAVVGRDGNVAMAFDKKTGEERWQALSAKEQGYCPPTLVTIDGIEQVLIWDAENVSSLNPHDGSLRWSTPLVPEYGMSIAAPRQSGDLLFFGAIGNVGGTFHVTEGSQSAMPVWVQDSKTGICCANGTPFIEDGVAYGSDCRSGGLRGVDLLTGERLWESFEPTTGTHRMGHGTAFVVKWGERPGEYIILSETGDLIHARLSREAYEELGRQHVIEPTSEAFGRSVLWSHPAFADGCCFLRNDREIVCVSFRDGEQN